VAEATPAVGLTYTEAGVDIAAGERAVELIAPLVASTRRAEVIGGIGGFGGLFALAVERYRHPVLVASTDGIGTKLQIARGAGRFETVGLDLVAMCVDDLVCQGAEPLFLLDYLAVGRLDPEQVRDIVAGIAEGCRQAGCALLGGEMAEHPGTMAPGAVDVAGFAVGVAERDRLIDGSAVRPGDALVGLLSPGLRSNGYSLARAVIERARLSLEGPAWPGAERSLVDELLLPSVIYAPAMVVLRASVAVHAVAHITGGGLPGNVPRALPPGSVAVVDRRTWSPPRIFTELRRHGGITDEESMRVFNLGVGMVIVVPPEEASAAVDVLGSRGVEAVVIGEVAAGQPGAPAALRVEG
jgi:phosphoribosylformylglycinamidine cyclo-ligase